MFVAMLFAISLAVSGVSTVLGKRFQLGIKNTLPAMVMYNLINAIFGMVYFYFICKCNIEMNLVTFLFSVAYALVVINSLAEGMVILSKVSIPFSAIIGISGSVIGSAVFGVILFGEPMDAKQILAMILLIGAVAVTALKSPELKHKNNSVVVCIWHFLTAFLTSPFLKIYTATPGTLNANNMFFMTNLLAAIIAAGYILIHIMRKGRVLAKDSFDCVLNKRAVINIASRTALSNIGSVISVIIIAGMDLTMYNILSSALGLIEKGCVSKFIFKEQLNRENYISILLALVAIVVKTI